MKKLSLHDKNTLVLNYSGEITWPQVGAYNDLLLNIFAKHTFKNTVIVISSSGGEPDPSWALYCYLNALDTNLITVGCGKVSSAAVLPYLAGKQRYVLANTTFLIHPTIAMFNHTERTLVQLEDEVACEKMDVNMLKEIFKSKLKPSPYIDKFSNPPQAYFISADWAVNLGIANQKIDSFKEIALK